MRAPKSNKKTLSARSWIFYFRRSLVAGLLLVYQLGIVNPALSDTDTDTFATDNASIDTSGDIDAIPPDQELVANGATVGKIILHVGDIFDLSNPKENKYFYRLANRLHINTKEFVVRNNLLFRTGDRYVPRLLSESERILRAKAYLFDAEIRPVRYHNNEVDIEVRTRDVWTLTGGVNYSHKGGESEYGFQIKEDNFAGLGKSVEIRRDSSPLRTRTEINYLDPFIGQNRFQLALGYSYNSDGHGKSLQLQRPFYSLETKWAMNLVAASKTQQSVFYQSGSVADQYLQKIEYYELSAGLSRGLIDSHTGRWSLGYTVNQNHFSATSETKNPALVPEDRELSYPWLLYSSIQSRYIKTRRINLIGRTEDINLGNVYNINLGWSSTDLNSDLDALIYSVDYSTANKSFADHMVLVRIGSSGRVSEGFTQNMLLSGQARYFYPMFKNQVFYSEFQFAAGHNLDADNQLLLGGDTGLRGYPSHVQDGNRKLLLKLEQRYYTDLQILQLAYVAGAAYFDIGRAWTPGTEPNKYSGFLKDVGIGLRLSPSRTSHGMILHLDLTYALDSEENVKNVQFLVSTESQF